MYKYNNLLSPFNVVFMYMFRANQIGLDNPPGGFISREERFSISEEPLVACRLSLRGGPCEIFTVHDDLLMGAATAHVLFRHTYC